MEFYGPLFYLHRSWGVQHNYVVLLHDSMHNCVLTISEPRGSLSVPHDCKFLCSQQLGTARSSLANAQSFRMDSPVWWLRLSYRVFGSLSLSRSRHFLTNQHYSHRDIVALDCYRSGHDRIRFASSVVCKLRAHGPRRLRIARCTEVDVQIKEQIQVHITPLPRFPHSLCPGEVDPCGSFYGGVISLSPPHLFCWPLGRSRKSCL